MRLFVTTSFVKATKKLHPSQKTELDAAVKMINSCPPIGEAKAGDFLGVRVYKFKLSQQLCSLAYRILDKESIKLLTFGPHENFYRDLKRQDD
jgi:mRNA-degrading endonuclease RelE of RelBE toxin-antitoxin system